MPVKTRDKGSIGIAIGAAIASAFRCVTGCGIIVALGLLSGCGSSDGRVAVAGSVTLDGQPLDNGVITFLPQEKKLGSAGAAIEAGKYQVPAERGLLPGKYVVAIDASDPTQAAARPDHPAMAIPVSRIPLRYNGATELAAEVRADDDNRFDFALEGDPAIASGKTN